ncbi:uncharacterized protein LOC111550358 [Piliocolobus tephrosceles]|uniref:uncharacterized protein LOC111550358 n=1 Tax=Piliocolobus tephrosceles TaxID=591936 RepID=UPI000C29A37A|nr:uncharacterized protein LOC111550358 [Piliocolobus tephrosceles]
METRKNREGSERGQGRGFSGHSREASASRHKPRRSRDGSPRSPGRETGNRGRKFKPRAAPAGERGHDKPEPSGARRPHERTGGSVPSPRRLEEPKHRPRSPGRTSGPERRVDDLEEGPTSPKRRRRLSPEAWVSVPCPLSRVVNHLGGLEVALGELWAPGGAFLPGPAGGTQPSPSQRAWLAWQLAHAGAALHWALATLDNLLAAGPWPAGQPPSAPAPGRPQVLTGASTVALEKLEPSAPEAIPTLHCKLYGALQGGGLLRSNARSSLAAAEQKEAWPRPSSAPGNLPPARSRR